METIQDIRSTIFDTDESGSGRGTDSKETVMIIDDNIEVITALSSVLKDHYTLIPCLSFEEANERLTSKTKVVLLDIKMSGKDGIEVFRLLKETNRDLRIIFHSAYPGSEEKAIKAESLEHDGFLTKGEYTSSELIETIRSALRS